MGLIYEELELINPMHRDLSAFSVRAMVDTGAMTLCIPKHVVVQLKLEEIGKREVTTADDRSHVGSYVGPVQTKFEERSCFTGALVVGNAVLMGAIPMEDMNLTISPPGRTITVNPESPNIPSTFVK